MKHPIKLTILLMAMFILTQLIGLYIINFYISESNELPYYLETANIDSGDTEQGAAFLITLITSFIIAIALVLLLMNIKSVWVMRIWFFSVIILALGVTLTAVFSLAKIPNSTMAALGISVVLAYFKVFKRNIIIHNATELMIYPGIAAIFVPILNIWTITILLIIISIYDIWAVWHSGIMQKMARFQMDKVKVFSGFFVPYAPKNIRDKIRFLRNKYKNQKQIPESVIKKSKIKINLAILGGGDIIFPIIAAGVFLKTFGLVPALCVTAGASLALLYLFTVAKKKKYYPAMPYLTSGIFAGMIAGLLILKFLL